MVTLKRQFGLDRARKHFGVVEAMKPLADGWSEPSRAGYLPVMIAALVGEQTGLAE